MFENYKDYLFNDKTILKSQQDLKVINIRCTQKKSIKLYYTVMMIRDYKHLIKLLRIHMEQMHFMYMKVK